jgi:transcriptional regulator with XRE-family HTH domain
MSHLADMSLGARIRRLRAGAFSQRELAEAAGVSIDVIRKLEQEVRHTASITTLQKIARALDVDLATLFGGPASFPSADPGRGTVAIRQALTPVDGLLDEAVPEVREGERVDMDDARRIMTYAWGQYWAGRFEELSASLPLAIAQLRATVHMTHAGDRAVVHDLLARTYWVTSCVLGRCGQAELAWLAITQALHACRHGSDQILDAAIRGSVSTQLVRQGRYDEAARVALRAATAIEPAGDVALPHLSVYGSLLADASVAMGHDQRVDMARELLTESKAVAARLGVDRNDYDTAFGPSQVIGRIVLVNVMTDNYVEALDAARTMPHDSGLPLISRAWHLANTAYAHAQLGHVNAAKNSLFTGEAMAPEWTRHYELARQTAAELVRRDRDPRLRDLATRLAVNKP